MKSAQCVWVKTSELYVSSRVGTWCVPSASKGGTRLAKAMEICSVALCAGPESPSMSNFRRMPRFSQGYASTIGSTELGISVVIVISGCPCTDPDVILFTQQVKGANLTCTGLEFCGPSTCHLCNGCVFVMFLSHTCDRHCHPGMGHA